MAELLGRWQKTTNLVSARDIGHLWPRHFADSAQLARLVADAKRWLDLGSGGGFPGLVVAALRPELRVGLVEANARKAAFLRAVSREAGIPAVIFDDRIEDLNLAEFGVPDVISARALAPVNLLLTFSAPLAGPDTQLIFPKGQHVVDELAEATKYWNYEENRIPSLTSPDGWILMLKNVRRR